MLKVEIGAIAKQLTSAIASEGDVVRYAAAVSVWGRWFVWLVTVFLFVYRPGFWYYGHFEYVFLHVPLVTLNGLVHYWLLTNRPITWRWLLVLSAMDFGLITSGIILQRGFEGFLFLAYYPALALFVVVFPSLWLGLAWTKMTAVTCALVSLTVGAGLDLVAGDEKGAAGQASSDVRPCPVRQPYGPIRSD